MSLQTSTHTDLIHCSRLYHCGWAHVQTVNFTRQLGTKTTHPSDLYDSHIMTSYTPDVLAESTNKNVTYIQTDVLAESTNQNVTYIQRDVLAESTNQNVTYIQTDSSTVH